MKRVASATTAFALNFVTPGCGHVWAGFPVLGFLVYLLVFLAIAAFISVDAVIIAYIWTALALAAAGCHAAFKAFQGQSKISMPWRVTGSLLTIAVNLLAIIPLWTDLRADHGKALVHQVPVQSGAPTFLPGDYVISERIEGNLALDYGELALYTDAQQPIAKFGRIVGKPGDHVLIDPDHVYVNGNRLVREDPGSSYLPPWPDQSFNDSADYRIIRELHDRAVYEILVDDNLDRQLLADFRPSQFLNVLLKDAYYLMADNRDASVDSRITGPVPSSHLVVRPRFIIWADSPSRIGWLANQIL